MSYSDPTDRSSFSQWKVTLGMIGAAVLLLIGWDVYAALTPEGGDTISEVTLYFALRHPVIPFTVGVVAGHLFWPQYPKADKRS